MSNDANDFKMMADPAVLFALLKVLMLKTPRVRISRELLKKAEEADIVVARYAGDLLLVLQPGNGSPETSLKLKPNDG